MIKVIVAGVYRILRVLFFQSRTPAWIVVTLLGVALTACVVVRLGGLRWFRYILFLVFVGGVLILFGYASSLSPNPKFIPSGKSIFIVGG